MIVDKVDVVCVTVRESEDDSPVPIDRYAPVPGEPTLERMELPAGKQGDFGWRLGRIDCGKNVSNPEYERRGQAGAVTGLKEPFERPAAKRFDQWIVMCQLTDCKETGVRPNPFERRYTRQACLSAVDRLARRERPKCKIATNGTPSAIRPGTRARHRHDR